MEDFSEGFRYVLENKKLIYGVLSQFNYTTRHPDFEDMVTEAKLYLAEIYTEYRHSEKFREDCGSYMFQCLKWRILDELRRKKYKQNEITFSQLSTNQESQDFLEAMGETFEMGKTIEIDELFYQLYQRCDDNEKILLSYYSIGQTKVAEIAQKIGKSRMTVNRWRKSIQKKYLQLIQEK